MNRVANSHALYLFLSLILGLLLLCLGLVVYFDQQQTVQRLSSIQWQGAQLSLASGTGKPVGESLSIQSLSERGDAFAFIQLTDLSASEYDGVTVDIAGLTGNSDIKLLWGRVSEPGESHTTPLIRVNGDRYRVQLSTESRWRGAISGLGVLISGEVFSSLVIRSVQVESRLYTAMELLGKIWHGVAVFQPWSQKSINFQGAAKNAAPMIRPVPLFVLWLAISILIYSVFVGVGVYRSSCQHADSNLSGRPLLSALAIMGLIAWLLLDIRWQWNFVQQVGETRQQFAGKSEREQSLAADDGPLFAFVDLLKRQILPYGQVRVLVLNDGNPYAEQRAIYHLLPHHAGQVSMSQLASSFRRGDYLLVLSPTETINRVLKKLLTSDKKYQSVKVLHEHALGRLFYFET